MPPTPPVPEAEPTTPGAPPAQSHSTDAPGPTGALPTAVVARARWSLMALFVLFGVQSTSWMSRLPSIREDLDVSSAGLGSLLIVGAIGALLAVMSSGALVTRFGSRTSLWGSTALNAVGLGIIAVSTAAHSPLLFAIGSFVNGVSGAYTNVPINLNAAVVEQRVGRAILPHFHAAFSIGAAVGALVAAGFSWAGIGVGTQMAIVIVIVVAVRVALIGPATAVAPERTGGHAARRGGGLRVAAAAWREPRTLLIGVVLLAASLSEGSAGTWLSLGVVNGFEVREAIGAAAYGTFVVAMTLVRFAGTGLIDRFGRVTVLRISNVSALVGLALFGLSPVLPLAWAGIALWGCGAALGNPISIAAASDDPPRAAARVSVVASFSSVAMLSAPPLLGLLADAVGERCALLTICAAMVVSLLLANQVRPLRPARPKAPARAVTGTPSREG